MGAFQSVTVPAGDHNVEFRYGSHLLGWGAGISLVALIGLGFWIRTAYRTNAAA
jgi:uncharacterized membrane protein YfhO